jgi:hypothetical protein
MSARAWWLIWLVSSGCAVAAGEPEELDQALLDDDPGKKNQGESLQGKKNQGESLPGTELSSSLSGFSYLADHDATQLRIEHGRLVGNTNGLQGTRLTGYPADGGAAASVFIAGSDVDARAPDTELYDVRVGALDGPSLCAGESAEERMAIALPGTWDARGDHHDDADRFTFACRRGVLSKCYFWGYRWWDTNEGAPLAIYHQACTRMARADYCGDGTPHTLDGTWIDGYDRMNLGPDGELGETGVMVFADNPAMLVEAGWDAEGAVCLSKLRWSTIPLDPACRARLPRCDEDGKTPRDWLSTTALLFSNSPVTDAPLYACGDGERPRAACSNGAFRGSQPNVLEGTVYAKSLPTTWRPRGAKPLYRYDGIAGTQLTTTLAVPGRGFDARSRRTLGYVLSEPLTSHAKPLRRYRKVSGHLHAPSYITTTDAQRVPGGYQYEAVDGWLPR